MRKVRIGNDINVRWEVKTDGQAVSLEGKTLKLYVRSAYRKEEITTFTVEGCVVSFTYPASMQRATGARAVILEDATEGAPRRTVCADQAFILVAHSCEENDDDVEFEDFMVSLQSNVLIGKPGLSAYEVWLSEGNTGTLEDWYAFLRKPATDIAADVAEAEAERKAAETARQEAEEGRITSEQERTTAETARDKAEQARQGDENLRKTAEENRVSAETDRNDAEQRRTANEKSRETAEQMRKTNEADRIRDEKEREAAETSRKATEKLRDTAENDRDDAEQERRQHEDARADAEGKRDTAETLRKQAETGRNNAEQERTTAEQTRKDSEASRVATEQERIASEQTRQENETARVTAETERGKNETERITAETERKSAEQERKSAEQKRKSAEQERKTAETGREDAEAERVLAETARATAEAKREQAAKDNKVANDAAVAAANAATEAANTATEKANTATANADTATSKANTAAEGASKVNAVLGDDHVLTVTDRTGAVKTADLGDVSDVARLKRSLGPYSERPDITLTAKETNVAISADGVKVSKTGWAIAEFTAELGNEYLFKPGATDGNVCVFAEYIDKIERRAIEYSYTYDEKGRIATAKATYGGKTHSYTYAYQAQEGSENSGENCIITDDQTSQTVDYLPATFQTTVGSYQPMTLLNADAELPEDGYCRFVSNFQSRSAIKVVVSYKADAADLTMKVVRDGMTASMCTQLSKINQKVDETKANIETLRSEMEGTADYYVAENDEVTGDPHFQNGKGNKKILNDWHFFLIDHTDNTGEATHPVGQLMDNNIFRFVGGAFAPTVGITEEMRAACDVQLYTDAEHTTPLTLKNGMVVTDKAGAHPYNAVEVYNSLGLVTLYDGEGNKVRQLLPWETTETKYSVMMGRYDTLYPVDRQTGESSKVLTGIFKRQMRYDGIDTGRYPLLGTALSPCPVTTVGNKTRNFFYAYAVGDTNTTNGPSGAGESMCSMYVNDGRTYPRTSDMRQVTTMQRARANNADVNSPLPFAEGGYHALNTFLLCMDLLYGTKYLHDNNLFGSGISSNDACNSESTWLNNGGVRCKEQGTADWTYYGLGNSIPFGYNEKLEKSNFSWFINYYHPKEQCMESQMAASWAAEFGISENTEYEAYGVTYRYKNITGVKGLAGGKMNCKVYRKKFGTCKGYKDANTLATYDLELSLRMSLMHGMNVSGDIFAYWGGGCEMVGTNKVQTNGSYNEEQLKKNFVDFYLEPNQSKWVNETVVNKKSLGTFGFESVYGKIDTFGPPILSNGYAKSRLGHIPYKIAQGGGVCSWQCFYSWSYPYWSSTLDERVRIAVRFRGTAYDARCSARFLNAYYSAATTSVYYGGSAQCRIVQ
jgi:hypothetical protein